MTLFPAQEVFEDYPTREKRARYSRDMELRAADPPFVIVSRPKSGKNRWKRGEEEYSEEEAVVIMEREKKGSARRKKEKSS